MEITAIQIHKPHSDIMCKHVSEFTAENGQRLLTINRTTLRRNIFDTIIHSSVKPSTIIALIDEKLVMERHTCRIMAKIPILTHRASFIRMWCTKDINTFQVEQPGYCAMISFNTPLPKTHPERPGGATDGQQRKVWALMYQLAKEDKEPSAASLGERLCMRKRKAAAGISCTPPG